MPGAKFVSYASPYGDAVRRTQQPAVTKGRADQACKAQPRKQPEPQHKVKAAEYAWELLGEFERPEAMEERRRELLHLILAHDPKLKHEAAQHRAAKREWDALLHFMEDMDRSPASPTPPQSLPSRSQNVVVRFFDYFFGAKHALPKQAGFFKTLLAGRVRSVTYHGRAGSPSSTGSPTNGKPRSASLQQGSGRRARTRAKYTTAEYGDPIDD